MDPWIGDEGRGAILLQQGSQWSADKAGVSSALRLHDATNAFPVNESRCGQTGSKSDGAQGCGQRFL